MSKENLLGNFQRLGKALMTPVAVLPAAALLLRLGADDVLNWKWMAAAGGAIFENLSLLFAIGIGIGFAEENNGVAGLAAAVGYFVLTKVAATFDSGINMGVLAGIITGLLAGFLYNKYKAIRVPDFLGFFGGKRFVPIITSFYSLILGILAGYVWPLIEHGVNAFGNTIATSGSIGAFLFGVLNRLLIPFGLHHVINTFVWFQFGTFTNAEGKVITGDLSRFFAGDPTAGTFMTGFFPIMMFALPAACIAMIAAAKKENRKAVAGMLFGVAFTSFLTGITEPIEFLFMFLAPVLYILHALLTGISMALTTGLGMKCGFGFSAGLIDYVLNYNISAKPLEILVVGLIFGVMYYFGFYFIIKKLNLPTPGRMEDEESAALLGLSNSELKDKAAEILKAIGGKENISAIDACVTRVRVTVKEGDKVDEAKLKTLGATAVLKMPGNNFQIVVGTVADPLVTHIKAVMSSKTLTL
ncbi:N-acetylglucosamine-specific PTS transporter subunit IIBC [Acetonema longum]|uniref:Phosphotransferase system IIC component n=1 Tax=Acetonema longum DSM 6540 TaxID=1009370 RepID=F7NJ50_9FIRM|nr:N-acetylglucosamine-specific PTS transporter subunit IIBC [Acetonema longum]EGO63940.1 phosphotransferase system IIC component [Acetonema longum DSM 6540]